MKIVSAREAVQSIRSGSRIHLGSVAGVPKVLLAALCERAEAGEIDNVELYHLHTAQTCEYSTERLAGKLHSNSFFIGDNVRKYVQEGWADYIPVNLHEIVRLYRQNYIPLDVAMVQVSMPDESGHVSLGTSVDITLAAVQSAKTVIAVMNRHMPFTLGDALLPLDMLDLVVEHDEPLDTWEFAPAGPVEQQIGHHCASLIDDGACLQLGIGQIPNAVLSELKSHRNLGLHTEMFACGVLPLVQSGAINGLHKKLDRGKIVSSFIMGPQRLYDFAHRNELVEMRDVAYTNDPYVIAQNPNVVAINSALEIDLTGQVCADSLGTKMYSGVGGQLDFMAGAARSEGGKAIIALNAVTHSGASKITPILRPGAGVVTPRSMVHYVVTEHGIVDLYGKSLQQRARLLIGIAAPEHREALERAAAERFGRGFLREK